MNNLRSPWGTDRPQTSCAYQPGRKAHVSHRDGATAASIDGIRSAAEPAVWDTHRHGVRRVLWDGLQPRAPSTPDRSQAALLRYLRAMLLDSR